MGFFHFCSFPCQSLNKGFFFLINPLERGSRHAFYDVYPIAIVAVIFSFFSFVIGSFAFNLLLLLYFLKGQPFFKAPAQLHNATDSCPFPPGTIEQLVA